MSRKHHHDFEEREDTAVVQRGLDEMDRTGVKVDEVTQKALELVKETKRTTETIKRNRSKPPATAV